MSEPVDIYKEPPDPPYYLINSVTGKHLGPFSTVLDAVFARTVDTYDTGWLCAEVMNKAMFHEHLKELGRRR